MIYETFLQSPLFWYLISGRQKTTFSYFDVLGTFWTPINSRKKYHESFSSGKGHWALETHEGSYEGETSPGGAATLQGRATRAHLGLERRLGSPSRHASVSTENRAPYFSHDLQRLRRRKSSPTPGEGRSCYNEASLEREIEAIVTTNLSLFCGEVILSDCVVLHMPLVHTMFIRWE